MKDASVKFSNYYWCLLVIENGRTRPSQQKLTLYLRSKFEKMCFKIFKSKKKLCEKKRSLSSKILVDNLKTQ